MANLYIPTILRIKEFFNDKVVVDWDFPVPELAKSYSFNVYTSLASTYPIAGLPVLVDVPRKEAEVGSPSGVTNFYISVSSIDNNTNEESSQSTLLFISIDHTADGVGGAVAKSATHVPKYLRTDEQGNLDLAASLSISGFATEPKQDTEITILESIDARLAAGLTTTSGSGPDNQFNQFWSASVPPSVNTLVLSFAAPALPLTNIAVIEALYVSGQGTALITLKRTGVTVWQGRIGDVNPNINPVFQNGGITGTVTDTFDLYVLHDYTASLEFSGNLAGYINSSTVNNEFNVFWTSLVPVSAPTLVYTLTVPPPTSTVKYHIVGMYITGQGTGLIELKRDGILVWRGRIGDVNPDINPVFVLGSIKGNPGQVFDLYVTQDYMTPLTFSGNLSCFQS
jgi:hypothetical protein